MNKQSFPSHWVNIELGAVIPKGETIDPRRTPYAFFELWSVPSFPNAPELLKGGEIGSTKQKVQPNDILLCKINPRINRVWRVLERGTAEQIASSEWIILRSSCWHASFIQHYLTASEFRSLLTSNVSGVGGSLTRARPQDVKEYCVPLPPLNEQRRIAAKVEELQSRSKKAREALAEAETLLEQLRQSVLHAAFTGKLTQAWREENPDAEPASKLLERIRAERRKRWEEAELAKYEAKGKTPPKSWQAKYPEPVRVDATELPELPEGWCWVSLDEFVWNNGYGTSSKCSYEGAGEPVLRIPNIVEGKLSLGDIKFANTALGITPFDALGYGDMLIIRTNGSLDLVGRCAIVQENLEIPTYFASYLIRCRLVFSEIIAGWISFLWNSPAVRNQITSLAVSAAGQNNISMAKLATIAIPVPSEKELQVLNETIRLLFNYFSHVCEIVSASRKEIAHLDQSILAKAFRGELVPQDPSDEPAAELLKRIKAERAVKKTTTRRRKSPSMPEE